MNALLTKYPPRASIADIPQFNFRRLCSTLLGLAAVAVLAMPASASTLNVPGSFVTIGSAISAANSGDTILVADGTYSAQNVLTLKVLTIKSVNGPASTTINCDGNYFGTYQGSGTLIQGFKFQNSTSSLGVIQIQTSATINNCIFSNNNSGFNFDPACINTTGTNNTVNITGCAFDHNSGLGAIEANSILNVSDSTFTSNTGQFGSGAIYANTATGQITRCTFSGNHSDSGDQGGAIYWVNGSLSCTDCSFTGNISNVAGGAVEIGAQGLDSPLALTNCFFSENLAPKGGAVSDSASSNHTSSITATNCVFVGNSASSDGAAIDSTGNIVPVSLNVTNCSFYGNTYPGSSPSTQGAISADGSTSMTVTNSILYGDRSPLEISTLHTPASQTVQFTDINQAGFAGSNGNINADPVYLNPLNGDLHIPSASPATHMGTSAGAPAMDYDGVSRPTPPSMGALDPTIIATHFVVSAPSTATAGTASNVTVTAEDDAGDVATGYTGTVHFTANDPNAVLPADAVLTNGTGTFSITLKAATQTIIRARDTMNASLTAIATIAVADSGYDHFVLTVPPTATAGTAFYATLSARDQYGNVVKSFADTIHVSSTDAAAVLPANFVLTSGAKQISVKLNTPGAQTITATDTANSAAITSGNIAVGTVATKFLITGPATSTVGASNIYTITAKDNVGNTATSYTGILYFTTTDLSAIVPANTSLVNGTGTFQLTFNTKGAQKINVTDTANTAIKGLAATTVR